MQLNNPHNYEDFVLKISNLLEENKATGEDHSEPKLDASKINAQRFKRLNKTAKLSDDVLEFLRSKKPNWNWTLIAEGWCGDAAQILPYINKMAECSSNISLEIILRDENTEIMDQFLTNNSRSIPILICRNGMNQELIGHWGPRPASIINWIADYKSQNTNFLAEDFKKELHLFYTKDKGNSINSDLLATFNNWL